MPNLEYYLGTEKEDASLRSLLRNIPMDGMIKLTFEREPSFFGVRHLEGSFNQTIIGSDKKTDTIVGISNRSIRDLYINGSVQPVGYLGLMRIKKEFQTGFPAIRGYQFFKKLHQDNRTKFYLTSIAFHNNIYANC